MVLSFACFVALCFVFGSYDYQLPLGFLILLWLSDTGAYLAGSVFGRHRMLERISPKKTWEGFIGGLLICCSAAAQLARFFPVMNRSEEHTSELQSLMRISYAVFCLNKKNTLKPTNLI